MPRRKSRRKIALIIVIIVIIILIVIGLRFTHSAGPRRGGGMARPGAGQKAAIPVTVVPVKQQTVPVYLKTTGTVQALNTVSVQPQVGGRLLSVNFGEGQQVKKGEVLAQIDPSTYQATYDQDVARMHSDQAQLATAQGNLARSQKLVKKNYISKQDLATQANTVKQLQATVAADKANAETARINLGYTKIRAPISGLTGIRQLDPGNVLTTSSTLVVLTHVHPINVMFSLPAQHLDQVRTSQADAPLTVSAMDKTDSHVIAGDGKLEVINNQIDPDSGTFTLKAQFPNKDTELWPGQFVNVRMKIATLDNALVIPVQAVERGPDGDYVYLLQKDNTVKMQPVTTGNEVGNTDIVVTQGLAADDTVVTEGQFRLKPNSKVTPLKPGELPAADKKPARATTASAPARGNQPAQAASSGGAG
jgi:multidrug efflux system membrane fusion protein